MAHSTNKKETNQEKNDRIHRWKRRSWIEFCRSIMKLDTRYSIILMEDYARTHTINGNRRNSLDYNDDTFKVCLIRDGEYGPVTIVPPCEVYGVVIRAGSIYVHANMNMFPSRNLAWPTIKIADELEIQYSKEVQREKQKRGQL